MKCQVCGARRQRRTLTALKVPVRFVLDYSTGETREFPAGTLVCDLERRKLDTAGGGSTSEWQAIRFRNGKMRRDDGREIW